MGPFCGWSRERVLPHVSQLHRACSCLVVADSAKAAVTALPFHLSFSACVLGIHTRHVRPPAKAGWEVGRTAVGRTAEHAAESGECCLPPAQNWGVNGYWGPPYALLQGGFRFVRPWSAQALSCTSGPVHCSRGPSRLSATHAGTPLTPRHQSYTPQSATSSQPSACPHAHTSACLQRFASMSSVCNGFGSRGPNP